ncbi:MAG: aspartyl/asparaginyl beta-hydroxylase domain-containing protein [Methylococcales bacterium]
MKHFKLVENGIDVSPFLNEITVHSEQWLVDTSRQKNVPKQRETQTITLRSHADQAVLDSKTRAAMPVRYRGHPSPMASYFPHASEYVDHLVESMDGAMGRAVIVKLRPHGTIYPHTDDGLYWLLRDRYHLVLKSVTGSRFKAGGEETRMQEGELWWFDPTVPHEAFNDSDEGRIHIIVDIMSPHSIKSSFRKRLLRAPVKSLRAIVMAMVRRLAWPIQQQFSHRLAKT